MDDWRFCVNRRADVRCRPEDGGRYLLYHPQTDELHLVGPVEKELYDLCDGRSIDALVEAAAPLLARLGVTDAEAVAGEVMAFLKALHQRALVEYQ